MAITLAKLQSVPALKGFSPERLNSLAALMVQHAYAPGEMIFLEGEAASGIWFILEGHVRIIKFSAGGRIQALCIANRGKCFGTCPLFTDTVNPANAQAVDGVTLAVLPTAEAQRLMADDPHLAWALLQIYSQHLSQLARLSESLGVLTVPARINDSLLEHAEPGPAHQVVHLTHERLAEIVGTVREVVSRHLAQLAHEGVVRVETGCITLLKPEALGCACQLERV